MKLKKNLTVQIYNKIKGLLLANEILPGQRLVLEDLANRLNVSRSPINNALILLMKSGYVDFVPNRGYSVSETSQKEAEDLWQARELIELATIPLAIRRLTPEKLEQLRILKEEYEEIALDHSHDSDKINWSTRWSMDEKFHSCIVEMSNNEVLTDCFNEICERTYLRHKVPIKDFRKSRTHEIIAEHEKIFKAIEMRDIEGCKEILKSHLYSGKAFIFEAVYPSDVD